VSTEQLLEALTALVESGDQAAIDAAIAILQPAAEPTEEEAKAEDPEDEPAAEDPEEDKPAASVTAATAGDIAAKLAAADEENKALKAQLEASAKQDYFKAQAVAPALQAVLESKSLAEIQAIVGAMQAKPAVKPGLGTVKSMAANTAPTLTDEQKQMRINMGLDKPAPRPSTSPSIQSISSIRARN
jgi:hypothetical protein